MQHWCKTNRLLEEKKGTGQVIFGEDLGDTQWKRWGKIVSLTNSILNLSIHTQHEGEHSFYTVYINNYLPKHQSEG